MASKIPLVIDSGQVRQAAAGDVILCPGIIDSALTSGRVVLAGASGVLEDSANLTFNGVTLSTLVVSVPNTTTATSGVLKIGDVAIHNYEDGVSAGGNLFLGYGAGNFTLGGTGDQAAYNVGIGKEALSALTTGCKNVCIGTSAGRLIATGSRNVALGFQALQTCTTGYENFALGEASLNALLGGYGNVCIGRAAGLRLTSGHKNIFLGGNAVELATTAYENIGIAAAAMPALTGGDNNIAIGRIALNALTTGNNNIAIGKYTLWTVTTGIENTALGYGAGGRTTGNNGVFLGRGAGDWETGSLKLYIDGLSRANEADGRIKALIYGVFAATAVAQDLTINGQVGVNIVPTAWLTLPAGAAGAGLAPLKLTSGTNLTTPEAGAIEFDGTNLYFTDSGGTRRTLAVV